MAKGDPKVFTNKGKLGATGGKYATKSTNLSAKTLKAAGASKAAARKAVNISNTKRVGSRTLGPSGKPLTGTVMVNGKKAVYKDGRRVQAANAVRKPASTGGSGGGGNGPTPNLTPKSPNNGDRKRGPNGKMNVYRNGKWVPAPIKIPTSTANPRGASTTSSQSAIPSKTTNAPKLDLDSMAKRAAAARRLKLKKTTSTTPTKSVGNGSPANDWLSSDFNVIDAASSAGESVSSWLSKQNFGHW